MARDPPAGNSISRLTGPDHPVSAVSVHRKRRRWWGWVVAAGVVLGVAALGACWLMFQHVPAWYRPPVIAPADQQRVRDDLQRTFDAVQEALLHETRPFERRFGH